MTGILDSADGGRRRDAGDELTEVVDTRSAARALLTDLEGDLAASGFRLVLCAVPVPSPRSAVPAGSVPAASAPRREG